MRKQELDTPYVIIDLDKTEQNIAAMQAIADQAGIGLRPHGKTHKLPQVGRMQVEAGAVGLTVAKLGEAEVMAAAGIRDILIAYPIVGEAKLARLVRLAEQADVTVALDSLDVAAPMSRAAEAAGVSLGVVVELDCGFGRVGLPPGQAVLELAQAVAKLPGLRLRGLLTFAGQSYDAADEAARRRIGLDEGRIAAETAAQLRELGLAVDIVSVGSTPSSRYAAQVAGVTEIRPGTYVFGDLTQVSLDAHELESCSLTVKVTVVSRPAPNRAVIDAGTKVFTMDGGDSPIGTGRGYIVGRPGITVAWFTEEHGMLELSQEEQDIGLAVGDTLEIIPCHCCAVISMFDEVAAVRGDEVEAIWPVEGRGKVR